MKKNAMMKIAAILMVAVLLTTCAISSTFAKYVTADESSDAARVAAFGVTVKTDFSTLFASKYDKADTDLSVNADGSLSYEINDLVAPGTKGGVAEASKIEGKPEVAVLVKTEAEVDLGDSWYVPETKTSDTASKFYCPLKFTIDTTTVIDGRTYTKVEDLEAAIVAAIEGVSSKEYAPNENLTGTAHDVSIEWEWAVEVLTGDPQAADTEVDRMDTYLGDQAAKNGAATISIKLTQSVTQLDTMAKA